TGFALITRAADDRWWPIQIVPTTIIRTPTADEMMVQSIAGLAAKAVNEGRGDEMVWVDTGNASLDEWCARWRTAHPTVTVTGPMNSWDLINRFAKRGHIKGYILYKPDNSKRDLNSYSAGMDCSVNVATSLAPLLDARDKTQAWCFQTYRNQFNRHLLCTQDPKKPHARDLAIAHKAFTFYGD